MSGLCATLVVPQFYQVKLDLIAKFVLTTAYVNVAIAKTNPISTLSVKFVFPLTVLLRRITKN